MTGSASRATACGSHVSSTFSHAATSAAPSSASSGGSFSTHGILHVPWCDDGSHGPGGQVAVGGAPRQDARAGRRGGEGRPCRDQRPAGQAQQGGAGGRRDRGHDRTGSARRDREGDRRAPRPGQGGGAPVRGDPGEHRGSRAPGGRAAPGCHTCAAARGTPDEARPPPARRASRAPGLTDDCWRYIVQYRQYNERKDRHDRHGISTSVARSRRVGEAVRSDEPPPPPRQPRLRAGWLRSGLRPRLRPALRPPRPPRSAWRRPRRRPAAPRRGAAQRLRAHAGDRGAQRGRLAPEPRLDLPRARPARGRGPCRGDEGPRPRVRPHRHGPRARRVASRGARRALEGRQRRLPEGSRRAARSDDAARRRGDAGRLGGHRGAAQARRGAPHRGAPRAVPHPRIGRVRRGVATDRSLAARMTKKRRALVLLDRLVHLVGLPLPVAAFQARAVALAARSGDAFALQAASQPSDVRALLRLAEGRRNVVELGTATGWTTASLALADPQRTVTSYDPVVQPGRARYAELVRPQARARMTFVDETGEAGAARWSGPPVDLLFIDSTHTREDTLAEFRAWRPHLAEGARVVFHDFGNPAFPGVAEAVEELALAGEVAGGSYVADPG